MIKFIQRNFELLFWIGAIIALAVTNPAQPGHFELCLLKLLGITWCPGCGIGHSISFLLHGDLHNSFKSHWLGIPALAVTIHRVGSLLHKEISNFKPHLKLHSHER